MSFREVVARLIGYINLTIPVLIGVGLVLFLWGLAIFLLKADNEQEVQKGKLRMIYGVIGFVAIFAVWGFVHFLGGTFGLL
jgi:hypothetical protein